MIAGSCRCQGDLFYSNYMQNAAHILDTDRKTRWTIVLSNSHISFSAIYGVTVWYGLPPFVYTQGCFVTSSFSFCDTTYKIDHKKKRPSKVYDPRGGYGRIDLEVAATNRNTGQ